MSEDISWGVLGGAWTGGDTPVGHGGQAGFVLSLLLRRPGHVVPVERLSPALKSRTTEQAVAAGRMAISRLRSLLGGVGRGDAISTARGGYVLDVDPLSVDHVVFEHRLREAEAIEWPDAALERLDGALALWRGEPFGEWRDWPELDADATAFEEAHRNAVDLWGELAVRSGRHRAALGQLRAAVVDEPLRERRWASLMLAQYRCGNQAEALADYERARVTLRDELGLEPGPELRRLSHEILEQDEGLLWRPERQVVRSTATLQSLARPSVVLGRETDIADVLALLERHRLVAITGFGGVGKSSLAAEVVRHSDRPAHVVALARVRAADGVKVAVAEAMGIRSVGPPSRELDEICEHLEASSALLVLDNCEHLLPEVRELCRHVIAAAPSARTLATSRVELDVDGARTLSLRPLATGTASSPGPAALIAADAAWIRPSEIEERWSQVASICRRADGLPLALELLGAAEATSVEPSRSADGVVADAVATAQDSLPAEALSLVQTLRVLPGDISMELLVRVLDQPAERVRRAAGFGIRSGLVVQRGRNEVSRIGLLEPARDVISVDTRTAADTVGALRETVLALAAEARPSLIGPLREGPAASLDDDHDTVRWLLEQLPPDGQLDVLCAVANVWRAANRTAEGEAWFDLLEPVAAAADDLAGAAYWVNRAQISPSPATRIPYLDRLAWAAEVADAAGETELALRAKAEAIMGLGVLGDLDRARDLMDELDRRLPGENAWARTTLGSIRAMGRGLTGQFVAAADELLRLAYDYRGVGAAGDDMANLHVAAVMADLAGDTALVRRILDAVDDFPVNRFSDYSHSALRFHEALLAVRDESPDAGRLLWEALGRLSRNGEHRPAEICRRELGRWRLGVGDPGGLADLAHAARILLRHGRNAAAVAIAHLVTSGGEVLEPSEQQVLVDAARALVREPGGVPLTTEEREVVDAVVACAGDGPVPEGLAELLRRVEQRIESPRAEAREQ